MAIVILAGLIPWPLSSRVIARWESETSGIRRSWVKVYFLKE